MIIYSIEDVRALLMMHTTFISKDNTIVAMRDMFMDWKYLRLIKKLLVHCHPREEIGSVQWLYLHVGDVLPVHSIIVDQAIIQDGCAILHIDDISITGGSVCNSLDHILRPDINLELLLVFHLVTRRALSTINKYMELYPNVRYRIRYISIIERFDDILIERGIDIDNPWIKEFHEKLNNNTVSYPFMADYKLLTYLSSYPQIYDKIFTVDRTHLDDVRMRWSMMGPQPPSPHESDN